MNLYYISQKVSQGYDTYSDAVVAAESAEQAQETHPSPYVTKVEDWAGEDGYTWAHKPEQVKVELIGIAAGHVQKGVICASFHAG